MKADIQLLKNHFEQCHEPECLKCERWADHAIRESVRRRNLVWSTLWVAIGSAAAATMFAVIVCKL